MEHGFLRHPRNLVYNASISANAKHNTTHNTNITQNPNSNNIQPNPNQNINNEFTHAYNNDQTTAAPIGYNVHSSIENNDTNSDHNVYRTDPNTNMHLGSVYNTEQDTSNNEYDIGDENAYNNTSEDYEENYEEMSTNIYNNTNNSGIYYDEGEEESVYSDTNATDGTTENNFMYNENTLAWTQTTNSFQNLTQDSIASKNTATWNSSSDNLLQNPLSRQGALWNPMSSTVTKLAPAIMESSHNVNQNFQHGDSNIFYKNDDGDNLDENSYDSYESSAYDAETNFTSGSNQVSNQNTNINYTDFENQHSFYNTEHDNENDRNNSYRGNENYEGDNISRSINSDSKGSIQKHRADMIIVLSLLQDMCTAVEYTESAIAMNRSNMFENTHEDVYDNTVPQGNTSNEQLNGEETEEFYDEEYEDENVSSQNNVETILDTTIESIPEGSAQNIVDSSSSNNCSMNQAEDSETEPSLEELSDDDSDEEELSMEQIMAMKNKYKRKGRNQRRNIRNVFSDGQLDAATKLLREKEQERLQRLGLKQSIENTGKILRASAVAEKPAQVTKKKSMEVICLDSDSNGDDDNDNRSSCMVKTKQTGKDDAVLILSSDSEGEEESGPVFDELVQSEDYYSELGLHTNDALNVLKDGKLLVNVNHNKEDEDIFLHHSIANNLKAHQIGGIRFLYDNLIESVAHFRPEEGNGCILAHAMGLGKTIQTITFIDLFLRYTSAKKVLCVVPVNTIQNWMNEFNRWLPAKKDDFNICDYVPKVTVPRISTTPKSKKAKRTKKQEEDHAMIQDLLDDMVDFVHKEQMKIDVSDVLNEMLKTVCKEKDAKSKPAAAVKPEAGKKRTANPDGYRNFHVFLIDAHKNQVERAKVIEQWDKCGGVLLVGYEMYRSIAMYKVQMPKVKGKVKKGKKLTDENGDVLLRLKKAVCKPGPDLVVCDEGHRIRNYQSGISQALKSIKTRKRLVLTGYPLQNNLIEYWCMVDFVRPNYLGSRQEFSNMFERPIMNGQCVDSTPKDKHVMKQRAHVLYSLLQGFVQRRGHDVFNNILPNKEEHVLMIRLAPIQKALYNRLIELTREAYNDSLNPVKTFSLCCKIWNHPDILYEAIQLSQEGKRLDIISDQDDIALDDGSGRHKRKRKQAASFSPTPHNNNMWRQHNIGFDPYGTEARDMLTDITQWASPIFKSYPYKHGNILNSGKFFVLKMLLDQTLACGDKMLIFSQSLLTLNAIELMLQKSFANADGSFWKKGRDYYRLDGGTTTLERERLINSFNDENNKETHLFVLSTRAGCLGINLVAANRVVVFDVSWNPCHDAQAVCRIYRYGQTKPCYIYRLVSSNTMEKKIYYRQISKQGISDRVVDEVNLTENFSKNEIASLVIEDWVEEPFQNFTSNAYNFRDPVMTNVLLNCSQWITKLPFEHESLLINENNQKLSKSEKSAAKREYEQERMMAQGSVPYRSYPLQQNFPRNTPVAPVRPFLWRPPPLNQSNSWLHPSTLFHHTVSHNVTVPSNFTSTDPLQILRQDTYTGDHSYTENDASSSVDREGTPDYWSLDSQFSSIRSAFSNTNFSNTFNRSRNLLNVGAHNDPLSRLSETSSSVSIATLPSLSNITPSISAAFDSSSRGTTVTETPCPITGSTTTSIVEDLFNYRNREDKSRGTSSGIPEQTTTARDGRDIPLYHTEQSLNFEDSADFYDSNSNSNDAFTNRDSRASRNVEVIVLDDDEDD